MRQYDADGRADISHRAKRFQRTLVMTAVYAADNAENAENHGKYPAQRIDVKVMDCKILEELELQIRSRRDMKHTEKRQYRTAGKNHPALLRRTKRRKKAHQNEYDTRMEILKHRNHRILSHNNLRHAVRGAS